MSGPLSHDPNFYKYLLEARRIQTTENSLVGEAKIAVARATIRKTFAQDPDLLRAYVINVACLLQDRFDSAEKKKPDLYGYDEIAKAILKKIFAD